MNTLDSIGHAQLAAAEGQRLIAAALARSISNAFDRAAIALGLRRPNHERPA